MTMKIQNQFGRILAVHLVVLIAIGSLQCSRAQEAITSRKEATNLPAKAILERVRVAYSLLSSYRDTGWTVQQYKKDAWTNTFSELLGARTCYRIELITAAHPFSQTNRFWCDGLEHCCQRGGPMVFRGLDLTGNLSSVAQDTSLPAIYFLLQWGNVFTPFNLGPDSELVRKPDEMVGNEDCYVVARTTPANPVTLWVGKQDFLIRRCQQNGRIETHENISTNQVFHTADFQASIESAGYRGNFAGSAKTFPD
jgi:hypothetical protein